jgi:hypothetical protein
LFDSLYAVCGHKIRTRSGTNWGFLLYFHDYTFSFLVKFIEDACHLDFLFWRQESEDHAVPVSSPSITPTLEDYPMIALTIGNRNQIPTVVVVIIADKDKYMQVDERVLFRNNSSYVTTSNADKD